MYRTDRSSAPLGLAVLFISLAIVPVSLRMAGYEVSISPSLSAAVEAWRGIAGALGNGSQSGSATELSLVKKYSFAETTTSAQEPVVTESCRKAVEADFEQDLAESWPSEEPSPVVAAAVAVQPKARPKAGCQQVALARFQRPVAVRLPVLAHTAVLAEARTAKCREREAGLMRVRELIRKSRALSEALMTIELHKNMQVFVKMKPVALFERPRLMACDGEEAPLAEPATEVLQKAGPRFGVGASEEPDSFEFFLEF
ncbi:MAG TPA: hypothetical protein VNS63_11055 [Blastocatellia bacterium]|nr:hypothetical protein [Blastocatellia bacterium]